MHSVLKPFTSASVTAAFFALLAAAPASVRAEDLADALLLEARTTRQQEANQARELVAELGLSEAQVRQLLPIVDEAAGLYIKYVETDAEFLPGMVDAFSEFAQEDSLNEGFSPPVERQTARLNHAAKVAREAIVEQTLELEERALAVLTTPQLEYVRTLESDRRIDRMKRPFRKEKAGMRHEARGPLGNDRLVEARKELDEIAREIHPRLGPVGRRLFHPAAYADLCAVTGTRPSDTMLEAMRTFEQGPDGLPRSEFDLQKAKVQRLRDEINNWNLINGLHLCVHQIEAIASMFGAYEAERAARKNTRPKRRIRRNRIAPGKLLAELERAVESVLNPGQKVVLADYKACLIPPKNLKDPVRVGQAKDQSRYQRWLMRARTTSGRRLDRMVQETLDREAEHLGALSSGDRRERALLLREVAGEATAMSDVDFELSKGELAEKIEPVDRIRELKKEIQAIARARRKPGQITHFMLKPQFIAQLKVRGEQLAKGRLTASADRSQGPQADNCENGCAVKGKKKRRRAQPS